MSGTDQWVISNQYGSAMMSVRPELGGIVESLQIKEHYQNKGHGSRFLLALERKALQLGLTVIALQVGSADQPRPKPELLKWYIRRGYKAVRGTQGWLRYKSLNLSK